MNRYIISRLRSIQHSMFSFFLCLFIIKLFFFVVGVCEAATEEQQYH